MAARIALFLALLWLVVAGYGDSGYAQSLADAPDIKLTFA
jgi:hypothetical protein